MKDNKGNKTGSKSCVACEKPVVNINNEYISETREIIIDGADFIFDDTLYNYNIDLNASYPDAEVGQVVINKKEEVEYVKIESTSWLRRNVSFLEDDFIMPEIEDIVVQSFK